MQRSRQVVPLLPASVSSAGGQSASSRAAKQPSRRRRAPGAVSKVAWIPQADLGQNEWLSTGRRLGAIGRCSQWWIGDWVRYGASRWGERYAEAARVTGYDVASLRNMAWVASRFDLSLRSDKLTWSHHVLLAPLEVEQQSYWLDRAEQERLSVADLRVELRAHERGLAAGEPTPEESSEAGVCPTCGHKLPAGED